MSGLVIFTSDHQDEQQRERAALSHLAHVLYRAGATLDAMGYFRLATDAMQLAVEIEMERTQ